MSPPRLVNSVPALEAYLRGLADVVLLAKSRIHPSCASDLEEAVGDWIARVHGDLNLVAERLSERPST